MAERRERPQPRSFDGSRKPAVNRSDPGRPPQSTVRSDFSIPVAWANCPTTVERWEKHLAGWSLPLTGRGSPSQTSRVRCLTPPLKANALTTMKGSKNEKGRSVNDDEVPRGSALDAGIDMSRGRLRSEGTLVAEKPLMGRIRAFSNGISNPDAEGYWMRAASRAAHGILL
jgi:hypothetical protein